MRKSDAEISGIGIALTKNCKQCENDAPNKRYCRGASVSSW
jgi:hypothetical protein